MGKEYIQCVNVSVKEILYKTHNATEWTEGDDDTEC